MKTLGIIAEYNPFHKGHKYHLNESIKFTGAECTVAVMSGNFTQRGEISPWDKWMRAEHALDNGIDLVLELPFIFAVNRAPLFAKGAVDILASMGCEYISFGSENGDIDNLQRVARRLKTSEREIDELQREFMKDGDSFARSKSRAVKEILGTLDACMLSSPNNILAIEYLMRINDKYPYITPVTVKRYGSGYFDSNENTGYAGASEIRKFLAEGNTGQAEVFMADKSRLMDDYQDIKVMERRLLQLVKADVLRRSPQELAQFYCMGEGLEYKFKKEIARISDYDELINRLTSKRYTSSAIRRLLLYMLVNLTGTEAEELAGGIYARVLAADEKGREVIRLRKKADADDTMKVITNVNKDSAGNKTAQDNLQLDIRAMDMYNHLCDRDIYNWSDRRRRPAIR